MNNSTNSKTPQYILKQHDGTVKTESVTMSTKFILQAADKIGVSWQIIPNTKVIELKFNGVIKYFRFQISTETGSLALLICRDKSVIAELLSQAGLSVPKGLTLSRKNSLVDWDGVFEKIEKPLVVKPTNGNQGDAVFLEISDLASYHKAVTVAFNYSGEDEATVRVEEHFVGTEYRIIATRDKVLSVLLRVPANVVGDGEKTIKQLVDLKNNDPRRGEHHSTSLSKILFDEDLLGNLAEQSLTLESILKKGQHVALRKVSNISKGGDSIDMTDQAHPSVSKLALQAMQAIPGLAIGGIDFMTTDLTKLQTPDTYRIIEVNVSAGIFPQIEPYQGKPRPLHFEFLKLSFPEIEIPKVW